MVTDAAAVVGGVASINTVLIWRSCSRRHAAAVVVGCKNPRRSCRHAAAASAASAAVGRKISSSSHRHAATTAAVVVVGGKTLSRSRSRCGGRGGCRLLFVFAALAFLQPMSASVAAEGLWSVDGPCEIDPSEPHCVVGPRNSSSSDFESSEEISCDLRLQDGVARRIEVFGANASSCCDFDFVDNDLRHHSVQDQDILATEILWRPRRLTPDSLGWRICTSGIATFSDPDNRTKQEISCANPRMHESGSEGFTFLNLVRHIWIHILMVVVVVVMVWICRRSFRQAREPPEERRVANVVSERTLSDIDSDLESCPSEQQKSEGPVTSCSTPKDTEQQNITL